ncbi:response regulator transcription factor [bacterium]|nr:response regulator transcription factor [bacterium]
MSTIGNILVVDDNPKYIADALPMYGYDVEVATDGMQALKILQKNNKFDLILLDVMMPNMDGWQTLKAIRNDNKLKHISVIMLTAVNEESKQVSGLRAGADDYITKPFILPNLLARIEALLRRTKWQQEATQSSTEINMEIPDDIEPLTEREKEVLKLVAKGANNETIANELFVKEYTVKAHLNNIFKKLKVKNRTQAVLLSMQMKITD